MYFITGRLPDWGAAFCASTIGGLKRNLTTSEMLRQIYQIQKITQERVSNIVVMGTGEPLDNYDNFCPFYPYDQQ